MVCLKIYLLFQYRPSFSILIAIPKCPQYITLSWKVRHYNIITKFATERHLKKLIGMYFIKKILNKYWRIFDQTRQFILQYIRVYIKYLLWFDSFSHTFQVAIWCPLGFDSGHIHNLPNNRWNKPMIHTTGIRTQQHWVNGSQEDVITNVYGTLTKIKFYKIEKTSCISIFHTHLIAWIMLL